MKEVILLIDTSDNKQVVAGLKKDGEEFMLSQTADNWKAQAVLPLVEKLLKEHKLSFSDLTAVEVNSGPGSFTGLRVGAAIANTLGTVLQIPINGKKVGEIVEPTYV